MDVGKYERLLEKHMDLVEVENFDYVRTGTRLLGRDIASIGKPETVGRIREVLAKETADDGQYRLIRAIIVDSVAIVAGSENRFEELLALLRELVKGIEDR